jgi:hypothetical protein
MLLLLRPCGALPNCHQKKGADMKNSVGATFDYALKRLPACSIAGRPVCYF